MSATTKVHPEEKRAWYLGNTTLRSPLRLKDGLVVLQGSNFEGDVEGVEREAGYARALHASGIVRISDDTGESNIASLGRKWRAALMQLGFITPSSRTLSEIGLEAEPYTITNLGQRLIEAQSVSAQRECFLRSLVAYQVPSPIESFQNPVRKPLILMLRLFFALAEAGLQPRLSRDEMAGIAQFLATEHDVQTAISDISALRDQLSNLPKDKDRRVVAQEFVKSRRTANQSGNTLADYADSNFRYLKATGLFTGPTPWLELDNAKKTLATQIGREYGEPVSGQTQYLSLLWDGSNLPTDDPVGAQQAIHDLQTQISTAAGEPVRNADVVSSADIRDLTIQRLDLEEHLQHLREYGYYRAQAGEYLDIYQILLSFTKPRSFYRRRADASAYFEWIVWRAFLAMNTLANTPWEARGFQLDPAEFLPIRVAPAGRPDLVFDFEHFVIVCEVTLSTSSRQEAMEGEPVRRHVADVVEKHKKPVIGLFIATEVNMNTVETFRQGSWFPPTGDQTTVDIVPMNIDQFARVFKRFMETYSQEDAVNNLYTLLRSIVDSKPNNAPAWQREITRRIEDCLVS